MSSGMTLPETATVHPTAADAAPSSGPLAGPHDNPSGPPPLAVPVDPQRRVRSGRLLVVDVADVSKSFGRVPALSHLSIMAVPKGRITVLLGPHGAGKTTAIRMITGALDPDRGRVRTFGYDPDRFGEEVRRRCGVVSAKPALYDRLSGWDNLRYSAELHGLGRNATGPHPGGGGALRHPRRPRPAGGWLTRRA